MARPSRTRLKSPIFWLKFSLKILHFLRLIKDSLSRASCTMPKVHIRTREVKKVLAKLGIKKSSGANGIPVRVLMIDCQKSLAVFFIEFSIVHTIGYNNAI